MKDGVPTARLEKFTSGVLEGKTMRQAALDAGYSESMARKPGQHLVPNMRKFFRQALEHHAPIGKLTKRLAEGLDAEETKFFQHEGRVVDQRNVIAWSERRQAAETIARLAGFEPDRSMALTGADGGPITVKWEIGDIAHSNRPARERAYPEDLPPAKTIGIEKTD